MGQAIELIAHFAEATSSSMAAGEKVAQLADEAKEPNDAAKGVVELCKLVDDASKVNSSICKAYEGLHNQVKEHETYCQMYFFLACFTFFSFFTC